MLSSDDFEFFLAITRATNLAQVGRDLSLSAATVTRKLADLETRCGVSLLHRGRRGYQFTDAGQLLARRCTPLLADMQHLQAQLAGSNQAGSGLLRVHATLGFGRQVLAQWIARYQRRHPLLRIQLDVAVDVPSLSPEQFDVAIRIGEPPERDLIARKLATNERWLVASPDYLREAGHPTHPEELTHHRCLVLRQDQEAFSVWRLHRGREHLRIRVNPTLASNHGEVIRAWAIDGLGIALRSAFDVSPAIKSGELVRVLPHYQGPDGDIYALFAPQQRTTLRVRQFVQFLQQEFKLGGL
jgi:LysR family transcriptional regulator, transcriptional activator for dmlA